jgi:hypothetical protein
VMNLSEFVENLALLVRTFFLLPAPCCSLSLSLASLSTYSFYI